VSDSTTVTSNGAAPTELAERAGPIDAHERLADVPSPLLTAAQVARMLGVPKSWVYEQSRKGAIPTVNLGRYRRYRAEAIAHWIESREAGERRAS
jgi:excisionase family DNA binding protein